MSMKKPPNGGLAFCCFFKAKNWPHHPFWLEILHPSCSSGGSPHSSAWAKNGLLVISLQGVCYITPENKAQPFLWNLEEEVQSTFLGRRKKIEEVFLLRFRNFRTSHRTWLSQWSRVVDKDVWDDVGHFCHKKETIKCVMHRRRTAMTLKIEIRLSQQEKVV